MANLITRSLVGKQIAWFLLVALVPTALVGYLAFVSARTGLEDAGFQQLDFAREIKNREVADYLHSTVDHVDFVSKTPTVQRMSQVLAAGGQKVSLDGAGPDHVGGEAGAILREMDDLVRHFFEVNGAGEGYEDFIIVTLAGNLGYTSKKMGDLGQNLKTGTLANTNLTRLWEKVLTTKKRGLSDFSFYHPSGTYSAFVAAPVMDDKQQIFGVLVLRIGPQRIIDIMKPAAAMGRTGETYLVGSDLLMRSESRFDQAGSFMKKRIDTAGVREALKDSHGRTFLNGYRGIPVLSSYSHAGLNEQEALGADFDWAIVAEMDPEEALTAVGSLRSRIVWIALLIGLIAAAVAWIVARSLSRPVVALANYVARISEGDLTVKVAETSRADEIGVLTNSVRIMVERLSAQIGQILDSVNVLAGAAAEISATAGELAANTTRTSAAMAETTTTVEQVRQAAGVASERAKVVAKTAQSAAEVSALGATATEATIQKMQQIREQMESAGETVVRLSEHAAAIEQIIGLVQDLAEQSNLLAVNASIEAARAGDQGRGFAVVAHEIKALADQSKSATEQVRDILQETRKWVSAVVMATEQGTKAVESGVEQSSRAADSIRELSRGVLTASQAATVIDSSAAQQFVGVEQVCTAMAGIEQALAQNVAGTAQLEAAIRRIEDLGRELQGVVNRYKVA